MREYIKKDVHSIQDVASVVAQVDVYQSLASKASHNGYVRPTFNDQHIVDITNGRHGVIEQVISRQNYVPNDLHIENDAPILLITGPNMGGKSTYMRQIALCVIMAQIGSFVPCEHANLPVFDQIFTRIGASDDLISGQSTFMVEMLEANNALRYASQNSLIIFDEIGRGTATFDGMAIAQAMIEYIATSIRCVTLFSTHYHELTELENKVEGVKNYSIAVKEKGEDIIFLRKIVRGGTDESYGIHVARLAGVPKVVTQKANEILRSLEKKNILTGKKQDKKQVEGQFDMYNYKLAEIAHEVDKINLNELTPIDALNTLVRIKEKMK